MSWLNRILPSFKATHDPARITCELPNISPLTLENLKLVPGVRKRFDDNRRAGAEITVSKPDHLGIVVPYRNREEHLKEFLPHMHAFLDAAGIDHTIIIAEQADKLPFNRGAMINLGAVAGWTECDHFCFHDVDLLPVQADYRAFSQPMRLIMQNLVGDAKTHTHFSHYFGGVTSISKAQMEAINGFSNCYWGWGLEDDNFLFRGLIAGLHPCKDESGTFRELPHPPSVQLNITGATASSNELKANAKRLRDSKKFHSAIKRMVVTPFSEGLSDSFRIPCTIRKEDRNLYVSADLASFSDREVGA
jgi:hypothetical protein